MPRAQYVYVVWDGKRYRRREEIPADLVRHAETETNSRRARRELHRQLRLGTWNETRGSIWLISPERPDRPKLIYQAANRGGLPKSEEL